MPSRHHFFHGLHQSGCFVIANPWDAGSARVMAAKGAVALATTSSGFAFTLGRPDMGQVSRDEALTHAEAIVAATPLPVSGDFENGFRDSPDGVAETVRMAREAGLSGCSIEDTRMAAGNPPYDFEESVARITAAVDAARSMAEPFVLCARADGVMNGAYDMEEALGRIAAFADVGADLVYVPAVPDVDSLRRVISATNTPVNALPVGAVGKLNVDQIAALGARRISLGALIARVAHRSMLDATTDILENGSFATGNSAANGAEVDRLLAEGAG